MTFQSTSQQFTLVTIKSRIKMDKSKLYINDTYCGETKEIRRISSGTLDGILNVATHFGWHCVNENYGLHRPEGLQDEYLVILSIGGCGDIVINNNSYKADKNKICIFPPSIQHSYSTKGAVWEFFWINIKKSKNTNILDFISQKRGYVFPATNIRQLTDKIDILLESQNFGIEAEINDSRIIGWLLHDLLEQAVKDVSMGPDNGDIIKEILSYIEAHYMEKITIDDLSRLICKSAGHTIRIFKYYTGHTPIEYIKKYRIMKACQLLDLTSYPIKRVAIETGYKSVSHFIADFKALKSQTPQEYRDKNAKLQKPK